ncbi:unnamed protein product [Prorocentrum cordatum]|uniref:Glycerophosphocholine acyltransferase 1 n=1 Tax=Prorocentrum cordatum TaxID=2364126 RepID=A0ABN9XFX0_9DINO|nr:unnamed protein product [Polarella glacialis]
MDKQYSQFNLFDWNDERWQAYLSGIYPPPNYRQLLKFRKKWYKRTIDPEFDVDYEPVTAPSRGTSSGGGDGGPARPNTRSDDVWANTKYIWKVNCFLSYLWSLAYVVSSAFQLVSVRLALVILSASVALELLARHGIQCRRDYLGGALGGGGGAWAYRAPIRVALRVCAIALWTPLVPQLFNRPRPRRVHALLLFSSAITVLLSLTQISPALPGNPLAKLLRPLAIARVRHALLQLRADVEVLSGFWLIWMCVGRQASLFALLWIWNALAIRYAMSPWTQTSFRKIDRFVRPVFGRIPLVSPLYEQVKLFTHTFAENKQR